MLCGALALAGCGDVAPAEPAHHGPVDLWAYVDPNAPEYAQVNIGAVKAAAALLNELAGSECFAVVEDQWRGPIAAGVFVVRVDDARASAVQAQYARVGDTVEAFSLAGEIVLRPITSGRRTTIAHEALHLVFGGDRDHDADPASLFSQSTLREDDAGIGHYNTTLPTATRAALQAFCAG